MPVGYYDADVIVNRMIIVETEIVRQYHSRDEERLAHLLKTAGLTIGVLINFGRDKGRVLSPDFVNL